MAAKKEILADFVGEMLFGGEKQISDSLFSELDDNHKKTFREWIGALIDRLKTLFKGNKTAESEITKLEAKFKEMLKESLKSEAPGETNTVSLNYNNFKSKRFSKKFEGNTLNSFGIFDIDDTVHIQRQVLNTLVEEGFFTDQNA